MAEPSSIATAAGSSLLGITAASMIPGVDISAVIGACGGALFFVTWARDLSIWARLGYLVVSWIGGYFVATEMVGRGVTTFSGLPALIAAALIVTLLISVAEWVKGGQMPSWIRAVLAWTRHALGRPGSGGTND